MVFFENAFFKLRFHKGARISGWQTRKKGGGRRGLAVAGITFGLGIPECRMDGNGGSRGLILELRGVVGMAERLRNAGGGFKCTDSNNCS